MRRTILLIVLLLVVVVGGYLLSKQERAPEHSYDAKEGDFAVRDIDKVARIVLTHGREAEYTLRKTSEGWLVNDMYRARMSSLEPLLEVIKLVSIRYIPPKAAEEHITWDIAAHGIQVDIYDAAGNLLKAYYVGGSTSDERGTHMRMVGSSQPFVMHVPTMDGSIRPRFSLNLDDWRDRHFLNIDPDDIVQVTVEYPRQKSQSFVLEKARSSYGVKPLYPALRSYPAEYRQGTGEEYLRALTGVACESYLSNYEKVDSIRSMVPVTRILITRRDTSRNVHLNLYPRGEIVHSEFAGPIHRLFVDMQPEGQLVGAQYNVIKGIFRGYDYFFAGKDQEIIF
jgi:hypothetical protein